MQTSLLQLFLFFLGVLFFAVPSPQAKQFPSAQSATQEQHAGNVPAQNFQQSFILVEDLAAEVYPDNGIITVTAKIKNVSRSMIRGYATVHLISGEGKRMLSYEEEVNDGQAFAQGTTVELEVSARVGDLSTVSSITVDFTKT